MVIHFTQKLLFFFLIMTLAAVLAMGWQDFRVSRDTLKERAYEQLAALREGKKQRIRSYFRTLRAQAATLAANPLMVEAMQALHAGYKLEEASPEELDKATVRLQEYYRDDFLKQLNQGRDNPLAMEEIFPATPRGVLLQDRYIAGNRFPDGAREKLDQSGNSAYDQAHGRYHPFFREVLRQFHLDDLLLVEASGGIVVYNTAKEIDLSSSLLVGPFKDLGIARAFREAMLSGSAGEVKSVDFAPSLPSHDVPAAFLSAPVYMGEEILGVVILQISSHELNVVMNGEQKWREEGLGETGEALLVGGDRRLRNDTRRLLEDESGLLEELAAGGKSHGEVERIRRHETTILNLTLDNEAVSRALAGETGLGLFPDYRGVPAFTAYAPAEIPGLPWAVIATLEEKEAMAAVREMGRLQIWTASAILLVAILLEYLFSRRAAGPVERLAQAVRSWRVGTPFSELDEDNDERGELIHGVSAMARELTEADHARAALQGVLASLKEMLVVTEFSFSPESDALPEFRISLANPAVTRGLGYGLGELTGAPLSTLFDSERGEGLSAHEISQLIGTGWLSPREKGLHTRQGERISVFFSASLLTDGQGKPAGAVFLARDCGALTSGETALRRARESFAKAQEIAHFGHWDWNILDNTLSWSDEIYRIFGLTPQSFDATYEAFQERIHEGDRDGVVQAVARSLDEDHPFDMEHRIVRPDGVVRLVREVGEVVRDLHGKAVRMVGVVQDVTDFRRAEDHLKIFNQVFQNAVEGVMITNAGGEILFVNPAFTTITGYTVEEALGKNPRMLRADRHDPAFYRNMWQELLGTGSWRGEIWNRKKSGEAYPEWLAITAIRDFWGRVSHYAAVFHDLSQAKEQEAALHQRTFHDALTGLPNRHLFFDRLRKSLVGGGRLAVILMDLDRFKQVNDTLGHPRGDLLLQEAASRLKGVVKEGDTVARMSGDEFAILRQGVVGEWDTLRLADELVAALKGPFPVAGHELFLTVSAGIALYPEDGSEAEILIRKADMALNRAKEAGRDNVQCFTRSMEEAARRRMTLEAQLRRSIENGDFLLHYQPKVNLRTGALEGVEALVRWTMPGGGVVSPADFIPLAEETGLILPLGEWVLTQACRQNRIWREEGHSLRVAVNLSPRQFSESDLAGIIGRILEKTGLPAVGLEIEITEGAAMADVEQTIATLGRLSGMGVSVAIDDFGIGYSSLNYLKRLPIHTLKIDQSFLRELREESDDAHIVAAILSLAENLGLETVAEGVERWDQLLFLKERGCGVVQGYYFSRPVPAEEFGVLLREVKTWEVGVSQ